MKGPYSLVRPCKHCPFRKDVRPYIHAARVLEIERSLERSEFPCHETTVDDGDGERRADKDSIHCAGALILMEKEGRSSQMMRIAERLGMYDARKLDMESPVYESFDDMYYAHRRADRSPRGRRSKEAQ